MMKMMHEHIGFPGLSALKVKRRTEPTFTYPWHFHREFELLYIIEGAGTRFVADSIQPFESGELVLLGSNLPHFWKNDESYGTEKNQKKLNYIVIQFPDDFFAEQISKYQEFQLLGDLFTRSSRGIYFLKAAVSEVSNLILELTKTEGIQQIILLLDILQKLSKTEDYTLLAGKFYQQKEIEFGNDRLVKVLHFIHTNYQQKIELEKIAEMAHMHPAAFCRYFKEKIGKSLVEYVNDMRIGYACKLIIEARLNISQVCFECGFNNLSNFNRTFKRHTGFTPTAYQKKYIRN